MILSLVLSFFLNTMPSFAAEGGSSSLGGAGLTLTPNFPHIWSLNYETLNRASHLTYAFGGGYIPPITISTAQVSLLSLDARARWHPFGGAFFLGLIGGYQNVSATGSTTVTVSSQSVPLDLQDSLSCMYATPHLGWLWLFGKLIIGFEGGMQVGFGSSNKLTMTITDPNMASLSSSVQSTTTYQNFQANIDKSLNTLGNTSIPYIGLKFGWKL